MSAGFAWDESLPYSDPANSERQLADAPDLYRYVLERPLANEPGRLWNYCGGATTLLQGVIQKTSGRRLEELAQELLFEPLGIVDWDWMRFPSGDSIGLGGLRLRPRDLAKLGQLMLDRGSWQGRQIIPAEWVEQSTTPQIQGEGIFFYGYHWWLGRSLVARREVAWAAGFGNGGQRVYIVPAAGIVVAITAGAYNQVSWLGGTLLNQYVLPAILD